MTPRLRAICLYATLLLSFGGTAQAGIIDDVLSRGTLRIAVIGGNPPYSSAIMHLS